MPSMPPLATIPVTLALLLTAGAAAASDGDGDGNALTVQFTRCTEFVGLAPAKAIESRARVPAVYNLVVGASGATLVVRVTDCQGVKVGNQPARPGRLAQVGLLISSPDGTATNPGNSINNYTLSYASNVPALVLALAARGVPAALDPGLAYEFAPTPAGGAGSSELYAAITPALDAQPTWFLHGSVNNPTIPIPFLANWWFGAGTPGSKAVKMSSTFPDIVFDFSSVVTFTTSRLNALGTLLPGGNTSGFPVSFRGAYGTASMTVTLP
jgi:hypothetical protein